MEAVGRPLAKRSGRQTAEIGARGGAVGRPLANRSGITADVGMRGRAVGRPLGGESETVGE